MLEFFKKLFKPDEATQVNVPSKELSMFCNQCEQTAKGIGCDKIGVCGKKADVAALQDLTVYALRGLALAALKKGDSSNNLGHFTAKMLFTTLTNVNFAPEDFQKYINEIVAHRKALDTHFQSGPGAFEPAETLEGLIAQGETHSTKDFDTNPDVLSAKQLLLYGMKGLCAYADHAAVLGQQDSSVYHFVYTGLAAGYDGEDRDLQAWLGLCLKCGEVNLRAMELLDAANTGTFGHPEPTEVPLGHVPGKAILVSGHDLQDLFLLLKQTEGKGINIYTHGEMLPCHAYPELKKFDHFYGHFGTAWQNQHKEFPEFPGAILFTTNCIQKPQDVYKDNVFTTGLVGWPGLTHIGPGKDFTPVIERALAQPGFTETTENGSVLCGFGHNTVMSVADKVIEGVKAGSIRHFFLVGGCDGAKPGRNYYTEFVEKAPEDTVILTLACGKFRFFDKKLGDIGGIPRLLDIGQCNDAYSAIQIAIALAGAFECGVNELPLSMILSWYEQKAVVILLTLLSLGITDIRLGPSLPAFISPNILNVLVENYGIKPITTPDEDLKAILG